MYGDEPLEDWLLGDRIAADEPHAGRDQTQRVLSRVEQLEGVLEGVAEGDRVNLEGVYLWRSYLEPLRFSEDELERLSRVYRKVMGVRGSGSTRVQEELLRIIGSAGARTLVTFWTELLTYTMARDQFSKRRRALALAALAYAFIRAESHAPEAIAALESGLRHKDAATRGEAAYYLAMAFVRRGEPAPSDIIDSLGSFARKNRALRPRYLTRRALAALGSPLPVEPEGGVYAFKVWHHWDEDTYRVIEIESQDSLDILHSAIQRAWNWDADHLYVFYVDGALRERRFEFAHDAVEEAGDYALGIPVGSLGLRPRHRLLYIFDFGDNHRFTVQCEGVREDAGSGAFPRVVEAVGEPMEQYPGWGDQGSAR